MVQLHVVRHHTAAFCLIFCLAIAMAFRYDVTKAQAKGGHHAKQGTGKAKRPKKHNDKTQSSDKTKHNSKDSVFTHLFSFPKYQLEMYRAIHPEDESAVESVLRRLPVNA